MFYSLPSYLEWYVESCSVINKANEQDELLSEPGYDIAMKRLLAELMEVYSPYRFVTKDQFVKIYKAVMGAYGEYETEVFSEEVTELSRETEGLMSLYEGLFDSGQICEPIKTREMSRRLGITRDRLLIILNKYKDVLPVQYAWRATGVRGDWRFDPAQIDNFKRWLMNRDKHQTEVDVDSGLDVSYMINERSRQGCKPSKNE